MPRFTDQALDKQNDLLRWLHSSVGVEYLVGFTSQIHPDTQDATPDPNFFRFAKAATDLGVGHGATYAVTAEIVDILQAATDTLPAFPLAETDLPTHHGFVYFERPLLVADIRGRRGAVTALTWALGADPADTSRRALLIVAYSDPLHPADEISSDELNALPSDEMAEMLATRRFYEMTPLFLSTWALGDEPASPLGDVKALGAFLRIVDEKFTTSDPETPSRQAARRSRLPGDQPDTVRVVRLRAPRHTGRPGDTDQRSDDAYYSHRFLVRGHWRQQWYPSQNRHAPRWINPFVKGPEDAPFVAKDTVFLVDDQPD